ncbi:MAG: hypothetical protein L6Q65_14935 [Zoogloea sp.]|nr:hypothetical protein [Zoogloea sp.]
MPQNLVSLRLSAETLASVEQAISALEAFSNPLRTLTADEIRALTKMGDKSAEFCRQTAMVLEQNQSIIPPSFDLGKMQGDLVAIETLDRQILRLKEIMAKLEDTRIALGSDIMAAASDGYVLMQMFGKAEGLSALQQAMKVRRPGRPRSGPDKA